VPIKYKLLLINISGRYSHQAKPDETADCEKNLLILLHLFHKFKYFSYNSDANLGMKIRKIWGRKNRKVIKWVIIYQRHL